MCRDNACAFRALSFGDVACGAKLGKPFKFANDGKVGVTADLVHGGLRSSKGVAAGRGLVTQTERGSVSDPKAAASSLSRSRGGRVGVRAVRHRGPRHRGALDANSRIVAASGVR